MLPWRAISAYPLACLVVAAQQQAADLRQCSRTAKLTCPALLLLMQHAQKDALI